ncbi:membrane protein [Spirochaetia bacterium]|nr:membrane protein [Spirochaetia bacterium]
MRKRLLTLLLILVCGGAAFTQTDLQTIATVKLAAKTEAISVKQLKAEVATLEKAEGRSLTIAERKQVLDRMINEKLVLQAAERENLVATDGEVTRQIEDMRAQATRANGGKAPTDSELAAAIKQQTGMDLPAFRAEAKKTITFQKYLAAKKRSTFDELKEPTDAEVNRYYNLHEAELVQPERLKFAAILVQYKTDLERAKSRELANSLYREINGSANAFDQKVALGQMQGSAYLADDTGELPKNEYAIQQFGEPFVNAVFSMEQGKISNVLEVTASPTARGFYIVKVMGKYPKEFLKINSIISLPNGAKGTVRDYIAAMIYQEAQQRLIVQATQELVDELREGKTFTVNEAYLNY